MNPTKRTLSKYGLTQSQWYAMWTFQEGKCALCRKRFTQNRRACVDHDHRTGAVRGLLCSPCNYELGCLHDDAGWLQRAASYLTLPTAYGLFDRVIVPSKNRSKP